MLRPTLKLWCNIKTAVKIVLRYKKKPHREAGDDMDTGSWLVLLKKHFVKTINILRADNTTYLQTEPFEMAMNASKRPSCHYIITRAVTTSQYLTWSQPTFMNYGL